MQKTHIKILSFATTNILFLSAFFFFFHLLQLTSGHLTIDEYYHIKLSFLTRLNGIYHEFPWSYFTVWKENFFDKDFLFHVLLIPFTYGDLEQNAIVATALFASFLICTLHYCISKFSLTFAHLACLAIFLCCTYFIERICCLRPIGIALVFYLIGLVAIFKNRGLIVFAMAASYALSYNTAFLLPLSASIYYFFSRRENSNAREVALASWGGMVLGYALHPNLGNAWETLFIQNFLVLKNAWLGNRSDLIAHELYAVPKEGFFSTDFITLPLFVLLCVLLKLLRLRSTPTINTLFVLSLSFLIMTKLSARFIEYWTPFSFLYCAATIQLIYQERFTKTSLFKNNSTVKILQYLLFLVLIFTIILGPSNYLERKFTRVYDTSTKSAALWLSKNAEPGAVVFTCIWNGPVLFFHNDMQYYMAFGDSAFFHNKHPDLFDLWEPLRLGKIEDPYQTLKSKFGVRYATCVSRFPNLSNQLMNDPRIDTVYWDSKNVVFRLK